MSAFLKDSDFFDAEVPGGSNQPASDEVDENGMPVRPLTILASSVERDIRVKIVDDQGEAVSGQEFMVEVADTGVYVDEDKDGVILISDVKPGEYKLILDEVQGFKTPEAPVNVSVKSIVSYTVIDDIDYFVHSENEIDILKEDTESEQMDSEDEDDTQYTALLDLEEERENRCIKVEWRDRLGSREG